MLNTIDYKNYVSDCLQVIGTEFKVTCRYVTIAAKSLKTLWTIHMLTMCATVMV